MQNYKPGSVSKIRKFIKALSLVMKQPSLLNHVINANEVMRESVTKKYGLPEGLKTIDLLTLFPDFNETVSPISGLEGTSTLLDVALLRSLAEQFDKCSYLEIGTWRGESVANLASVAHDCITVNLPDKEMIEMGLPKKYVESHRFFSRDLKNVEHIQHNSSTFDFKTLNKKFDLIFVDGDHHYQQVKNDTAKVFELLRDENSVIVWHDYAYQPGDVRFEVLAGIMDGCPDLYKGHLYHVSNTLCAIFTRRNYQAKFVEAHDKPTIVFDVKLTGHRI